MPINPGTELASLDFANLIGGPLCAIVEAQTIAAKATAAFIKDVGFYPPGTPALPDGTVIEGTPIYVDFKYPKEIAPYQPAIPEVIGHSEVESAKVTAEGMGYPVEEEVIVTFSADTEAEETAASGKVITDATGRITLGTAIVITNPGYYRSETPPEATIADPGGGGTQAVVGEVTLKEIGAIPGKLMQPAEYQTMKISVPILTILPIPFIRIETATIDFNAKINSVETTSESTDLTIAGSLEVRQRWPSGRVRINGSASFQKKTLSGSTVEKTYSMQIHIEAAQDEMPEGMEKLLNILEGAMISTPVAS